MSNITVELTERGYEIRFPYNEGVKNAVKSIKNSWFRSADKTWIVPPYQEHAVEAFKRAFKVSDPSRAVLDMPEAIATIPDMPELTIPLPLKREPFHFQKQGIARAMQLKRLIIGDKPGLGKSQQAIGAAIAMECKCILVICPATLKLNWQKEWMEVAGMKSMILSDKNKASWMTYYEVGMVRVFITNYDSLKKYFVKAGWKKPAGSEFKISTIPFRENINLFDCIIIDEFHNIKDGTKIKSKLTMGISKGKPVIMGLTGTPVVNKPKDLLSQLACIGRLAEVVDHIPLPVDDKTGRPKDFSGYNRFLNRYCDGGNGATNLRELNSRLYATCFFSREKSEVLKDLPDKIRQVVYCEITNMEEYVKAEDEFVQYLKDVKQCTDEEVAKKLRGQMMVKMGILKQISARGKIETAREYMDEVIDAGQKIVVFVHLKDLAAELMAAYPDAVSILGKDSLDARQGAITSFQTKPAANPIICSLTAAGVGVTLTAASEVLLIEQPWTDALVEQAIDRTHRIGQTNKVRAGILLGKDTIDEYVYDIIMKKRKIAFDATGSGELATDEVVDDLLKFFGSRMKDVS